MTIKDTAMGLKFFQYWLPDYVNAPLPRKLLSGLWSSKDSILLGHLISQGLYIAEEDEQAAGHGLNDAIVDGLIQFSRNTGPSPEVGILSEETTHLALFQGKRETSQDDYKAQERRNTPHKSFSLPITW